MSNAKLDVAWAREQFAAFQTPSLHQVIMCDAAGGSYVAKATVERLGNYLTEHKFQSYAHHLAGRASAQLMKDSHDQLAALLNVNSEEIHFGTSTTANASVLAGAMRGGSLAAGGILGVGDEIVVTNADHEANIGPWRRLATTGVVVREWRARAAGSLDLAELDLILTAGRGRVKMLAVTHVSNVIGVVNDLKAIVDLCHSKGCLVVADGVAAVPHSVPDLKAIDVDAYLFSLYKTWGPHLGLMYVKSSLTRLLAPMCHFFNEGITSKVLTPAGPDHAHIAAARGMCDYIDGMFAHHFPSHKDKTSPLEKIQAVNALMRESEIALMRPLLRHLQLRKDYVRILGPPFDPDGDLSSRCPTISLVPLKVSPLAAATALGDRGVACGIGHFYAHRLVHSMGLTEVVRISFLHYNTQDEIKHICTSLDVALGIPKSAL